MNPENYEHELNLKAQSLKDLFSAYTKNELEIFKSDTAHYRMRAEFRVWHDKDDLYFYMFDQETKEKVRTDQFLPASKLINDVMKDLMDEIKFNMELRGKLFQVDFLSTLSGEILVSLLYHKKLADNWISEAKLLKEKLSKNYKIDLIGRAKKQKILVDRDHVIEELEVQGKKICYKQVENSFTQPNANVAVKMLEWCLDLTKSAKGDLLELYCGNGNFSIALASHFRKVLATELAAPSVEAAQFNIEKNQVKNVDIIRMSAEDFSFAMEGGREFQRLRGIDLKSYECQTILVDPPRQGLDFATLDLVSKYDKIIYISCNPNTLLANMEMLAKTHMVERFALFDQFPYTHHMECGVYLKRK